MEPVEEQYSEPAIDQESSSLQLMTMDRNGWVSVSVGLVLALIVFFYSPLFGWISHYVMTLLHEVGHSFFAAIFGYPSMPAFDFQYGGGFAPTHDRRTWLVVIDYLIIFLILCLFIKRIWAVLCIIVFTIIYSILAFTKSHTVIYYFMGHGSELVFASIFLYRAMSGSSVIKALEQPLYAFLAFFIYLSDFRFAYKLLTDKTERILYGFGKGGHPNDFVVIARDYLNVDLKAVAAFFLVCCIVVPILTVIFFVFRNYVFFVLNKVFFEQKQDEVYS